MKRSLKWAGIATGIAGIVGAAFVGGRAWAGGGIPATGALTYSGLLQDSKGAPLAGPEYMEVQFWNDPNASAAGNLLCDTGTPTVTPLVNGRFSIPLPDTCTTKVGSNAGVYVDVIVGPTLQDAVSLGTRAKIGAVPFAVEANHAANADVASQAAAGTFSVPGNMTVGGNATVAGKLSVGLHLATNCTTAGSLTTCVCAAGEVAIGGGASPTTTSGSGYLSSSRGIVYSSALTDTWEVGCKSDTGVPIACSGVDVICARLAQ